LCFDLPKLNLKKSFKRTTCPWGFFEDGKGSENVKKVGAIFTNYTHLITKHKEVVFVNCLFFKNQELNIVIVYAGE